MTEFIALRAKEYAYLMEDGSEYKISQRNKKACNKMRTYVRKLQRFFV